MHQLRLVVSSHYFQGFIHSGCCGISEPSTVAPEIGWLDELDDNRFLLGFFGLFSGAFAVIFREGIL